MAEIAVPDAEIEASDKANRANLYLPDQNTEHFLRKLNDTLAEDAAASTPPQFPCIFVTGGPRSGTTVLAQALTSFLDCGYIDNLAAKFWKAPATGLRLSHSLFGDRSTSHCNSEYGRTSGSEIHGYHYFWLEQLKIESANDLFSDPVSRHVKPATVLAHIANMQSVCHKPMVFKGYYPSYFMPWFARHLRDAIFVVIKRTPRDQANSIYQARSAYMQQMSDWWSMFPPEYESLLNLSPARQIAGQIFGLRRMFANLGSYRDVKAVSVNFEDFISQPGKTLHSLAKAINDLSECPVTTTGRLPVIHSSGKTLSKTIESELAASLAEFSHWEPTWTY